MSASAFGAPFNAAKTDLNDMPFEKLYEKFTKGKIIIKDAKEVHIKTPIEVAEGDYNFVEVEVEYPFNKTNYISKITVLTTKNRINFVASADFSLANGKGYLYTRTKLEDAQDIVFLCETNDGRVFEKRKYVSMYYFGCEDKYTKRKCGEWILKQKNASISIKNRDYKIGDIVQTRASIIYPAIAGFDIDHCTGKQEERFYIKNATVYFENKKVVSFELGAAQTKHSSVRFPFEVLKKGILKIIWENNRGEKFERETIIKPID